MENLLIVPSSHEEFSFLKELLAKLNITTTQEIFEIEQIDTENRSYALLFPLRCLQEKEEEFFVLRNEMLDLVGTGRTPTEAMESFLAEFDFAYIRFNELPNEKLSDRLLKIKKILNFIVK